MAVKRTLHLETVKDTDVFHQMTVEPGLSADEIVALAKRPPFHPLPGMTKQYFAAVTGQNAGWPYEFIQSETPDQTVFTIPDTLLDFTREDLAEIIARKLATFVSATLGPGSSD